MPDGGDSHRIAVVGQLVDHPIRADPQRSQPAKPASKRVTGFRFSFEQAEGVHDGFGDRPIQLDDIGLGTTREDDPGQGLPGPAPGDLRPELGKGHRVAAFDVGQTRIDGGESLRIGEDLGGLLQRVVLVHGDEHSGRAAAPGDDDVLPAISDLVEQVCEVVAQFPYGDDLAHASQCTV